MTSRYTILSADDLEDGTSSSPPPSVPAPSTLASSSPVPPTTAAANLTLDDDADRLAFQQLTASSPSKPNAQPFGTSASPSPAPASGAAVSGKMGGDPRSATTATASKTVPVSPGSLPLPVSATASTGPAMRQPVPPPADAKLWQVEYYARYFDVDTSDVMDRIRWSLYPNASFATSLTLKQDLYGPFWVPTTLIFTLFVTSSLAHSIASYIAGKPYVYDFTRLTAATSTIYTYVYACPAAIYALARYYGRPIRIIDLVTIYGYGVALWVPIALLCIMPFELVRWILVAVTFLITGTFLGRNMHIQLTELTTNNPTALPPKIIKGVLVTGAALHAVFALLLKLMFFNYNIAPAS